MADRYALQEGTQVTLDAAGEGEVRIGPTGGPARWHVTGVILQTDRPGQAPIPRAQVWIDEQSARGTLGLSYDGSFAQGRCDLQVSRGQSLIVKWVGGQAGDIASVTVTGEKW